MNGQINNFSVAADSNNASSDKNNLNLIDR